MGPLPAPVLKHRRGGRLVVLVAVLLCLVAVLVLPRAGEFLVVEDSFDHADAVVVLAGAQFRRVFGARDLYQQGRVGQVLISPEPVEPAIAPELARLGLPDQNRLHEAILTGSGVPAASIAFLPESESTIMEAQRVREYFGDRLPPRLAVVTSRLATRRACFIFQQVLHDTRILCVPTAYDPYGPASPDVWWARRGSYVIIATEYQKLFVNTVELVLARIAGRR
jgi:uncharacterized SAM-binding protein YcdF (DUF218 family)